MECGGCAPVLPQKLLGTASATCGHRLGVLSRYIRAHRREFLASGGGAAMGEVTVALCAGCVPRRLALTRRNPCYCSHVLFRGPRCSGPRRALYFVYAGCRPPEQSHGRRRRAGSTPLATPVAPGRAVPSVGEAATKRAIRASSGRSLGMLLRRHTSRPLTRTAPRARIEESKRCRKASCACRALHLVRVASQAPDFPVRGGEIVLRYPYCGTRTAVPSSIPNRGASPSRPRRCATRQFASQTVSVCTCLAPADGRG